MQYKETSDTQTVKMILDEKFAQLEADGKEMKIFKDWVVLRIQSEISWSQLHNKIKNYPSTRSDCLSEDGSRNIRYGANKVFRDALKSMKQIFRLDKGWVFKIENADESCGGLIEFNGQLKSIPEWSVEQKIPEPTLRNRFIRGWSVEKALTEPLKRQSARWAVLLDLITDDWSSKEYLKEQLKMVFPKSELIRFGLQRVAIEKKSRGFIRQKKSEINEDRLVARGVSDIYNSDIFILRKKKLIEERTDEDNRVWIRNSA